MQSNGHGSVLKLPASTGRAACAWQQLRPPACLAVLPLFAVPKSPGRAQGSSLSGGLQTTRQFAESVQCSLEHSMFGSSFCHRATNGSLSDISDSRGSEALGQSRVGSGLTRQSRFGTVAQQRKFRLGHGELAPDPSCPACQSPIDSPLVLHRILNRPGTISIHRRRSGTLLFPNTTPSPTCHAAPAGSHGFSPCRGSKDHGSKLHTESMSHSQSRWLENTQIEYTHEP